jgi:serine/threonine protein kinase
MESDVWSVGCMLYTLIVGKPPFEVRHACLASFLQGEFVRAKRLFPLSTSLIALAKTMPTKEKVALREQIHPVENRLYILVFIFLYSRIIRFSFRIMYGTCTIFSQC